MSVKVDLSRLVKLKLETEYNQNIYYRYITDTI